MGKKWDGKTLKQSHITHINKYISFYTDRKYRPKFTQAYISHLWICSNCGKFKHQHTQPAYKYRFSFFCEETHSAVKKLIAEAEKTYDVREFLFCDTNCYTRTFTRMFSKNEDLSLLIEAYIKLTRHVESST